MHSKIQNCILVCIFFQIDRYIRSGYNNSQLNRINSGRKGTRERNEICFLPLLPPTSHLQYTRIMYVRPNVYYVERI